MTFIANFFGKNPSVYVQMEGVAVENGNRKEYLIVIMDISKRKQAEKEKMRLLQTISMEISVTKDIRSVFSKDKFVIN